MVTGSVVGTSHKGVRHLAASGLANAETGKLMTPETPVHVASVTKPIVTTAFLLTAKELLDSPVHAHLPDLHDAWRASAKLTPRNLLSHTSGLRRKVAPGDGLTGAVRMVVSQRQEFRPGRAWAYCNGGFYLAGLLMARLRGSTFEQAVEEAVLEPVGMRHSGFERPAEAAAGHRLGRVLDDRYLRSRAPAGGLVSTVADLLTFAEFLLEARGLLGVMTQRIAVTTFGSRYGLGWELGEQTIWHRGDWGGYRSCLLLAPAHRFATVAVVNDATGSPTDIVAGELKRATGLRSPWKDPWRLPRFAYAGGRLLVAKLI